MEPRPTCPICASTICELLRITATTPIVRCTGCRFIFRLLPASPAPAPPVSLTPAQWDIRLQALENAVGRGTMLHVGDGDSPFPRMAKERGWQVEYAVAAPREGRWPAGSFDAITLWNGLEYQSQPADLLKLSAHYCRVDGVLALQSLKADPRTAVDAPEAARLFSPTALQRYLGRFGFRTEKFLPFDGGGSPTLALIARYVP